MPSPGRDLATRLRIAATALHSVARKVARPIELLAAFLYGRDVFISYARADGYDYANALAKCLMDSGYSVRADFHGSERGKKLPTSLLRDCRRSKILVVVASAASAKSDNV